MGVVDSLTTVGPYIDLGGGLLYVALAVWVLSLKPRSGATLTFGIFGLFMGGYFAVSNVVNLGLFGGETAGDLLVVLALPVFLVAGSLAAFFPVKPRGDEAKVVIVASAVGLFLILLFQAVSIRDGLTAFGADAVFNGRFLWRHLGAFHNVWLTCGYWVLLIGWAWRYPLLDASVERRWRRQVQTVSLALIIYHSVYAGILLAGLATYLASYYGGVPLFPNAVDTIFYRVVPFAVAVAVAAKWLSNMRDADGWDRRRCRTLAWTSLTLMAVGMLGHAWLGEQFSNTGIMGLTRIVGVLMIVHSLLRYRLFDLHIKLKFAIRSSTLAGLFAGVFFIVAESLEVVFGIDSAGGSILAAVAIALALRPLQWVSARLAQAVLPRVDSADDDYVERRKWRAFGDAVRSAERDGKVTAREAAGLVRLVEDLGLDEEQAAKLRERLTA